MRDIPLIQGNSLTPDSNYVVLVRVAIHSTLPTPATGMVGTSSKTGQSESFPGFFKRAPSSGRRGWEDESQELPAVMVPAS